MIYNQSCVLRNAKEHASLAQLVEHLTLNQGVQGSSPWRRTQELIFGTLEPGGRFFFCSTAKTLYFQGFPRFFYFSKVRTTFRYLPDFSGVFRLSVGENWGKNSAQNSPQTLENTDLFLNQLMIDFAFHYTAA